MKVSIKTGFIAGCIGAIILVAVMLLMDAAGLGEPGL